MALKFDTDKAEKPSLSLLPTKPLYEVARVLDFGKVKYTAHNWREGLEQDRLLSAAMRHILLNNEGGKPRPRVRPESPRSRHLHSHVRS